MSGPRVNPFIVSLALLQGIHALSDVLLIDVVYYCVRSEASFPVGMFFILFCMHILTMLLAWVESTGLIILAYHLLTTHANMGQGTKLDEARQRQKDLV